MRHTISLELGLTKILEKNKSFVEIHMEKKQEIYSRKNV